MAERTETIAVRVVPNARRDECLGAMPGTGEIKIKLAAPAVDGKANRALVAYLSERLGVAKGGIEIVRGEKSRSKVVSLSEIDADTAFRRLSDPTIS